MSRLWKPVTFTDDEGEDHALAHVDDHVNGGYTGDSVKYVGATDPNVESEGYQAFNYHTREEDAWFVEKPECDETLNMAVHESALQPHSSCNKYLGPVLPRAQDQHRGNPAMNAAYRTHISRIADECEYVPSAACGGNQGSDQGVTQMVAFVNHMLSQIDT